MLIPKNHEKLQVISDVVREELSEHEVRGGVYHDEMAGQIAGNAIRECMPELLEMRNRRIAIEAFRGITLEGSTSLSYDWIHVEAVLQKVIIQQLVESLETGTDVPLRLSDFDLCAVLTPVYIDPDPQAIMFGEELYVPFATITQFEKAS